ncbi:hypothetical protein BIZ37_27090 [Photobacterium sp. BZF1]|uniref:hypothetical protein n=1 Tax=Photobacterium sp. BZF1 TaxID=1904457 RepID=UPI00165346B8|nr:hypothetical protein [Photobacterium sp. BZF1]MBC7006230.1 hypothetical protein [Photobacterium sp. BZF1]
MSESMKEKQLIKEVTRLRYDVEELKRELKRIEKTNKNVKWYKNGYVTVIMKTILLSIMVSIMLLFGLLSMQ